MRDVVVGLLSSKTVWVNAVTLLAAVFASEEIRQLLEMETVVKIQAGLNLVLRLVTWQSIREKGAS